MEIGEMFKKLDVIQNLQLKMMGHIVKDKEHKEQAITGKMLGIIIVLKV